MFAEDMVALSGSQSMSLLPATIYSEAAVCVCDLKPRDGV